MMRHNAQLFSTVSWACAALAALMLVYFATAPPILVSVLQRHGWHAPEAQGGDYLVELLSSNQTSASATLLYSRTSHPPERIQFRTVLVEAHRNR